MIKKIIVATDASEYSRHALSLAVDIARQNSAMIILLHVINPQPYQVPSIAAHFFQELVDDIGKKVMETTLSGIDMSDVPYTTKIRIGNAAHEIVEEIDDKTDLLVMGTRGQGALRAAIMGSVAQKVVAEAKCPVLVVK
jgi:nucleotide-binding universal stress UspA family protein